jgi:predicted RNase H-like nuclease (RuvC/YqgF family)
MQQGTILDVLKKKMRQTKEEMEKYKDECEEYHKRLQVEIMRREEVSVLNVFVLCRVNVLIK